MKPTVKLISGYHITATDKRTILAVIDHLRGTVEQSGDPDYLDNGFLGASRSPKSYCVLPCPINQTIYTVMIKTNEAGGPRKSTVTLQIQGIDHLYRSTEPAWMTEHLQAQYTKAMQSIGLAA